MLISGIIPLLALLHNGSSAPHIQSEQMDIAGAVGSEFKIDASYLSPNASGSLFSA